MAEEIIKLIEYFTSSPFVIGAMVLYALLFVGIVVLILSIIRAVFLDIKGSRGRRSWRR